jgi:hypothetical protein
VAKYHGGLFIIGNHFRDGGNVMLWGGAIDSVVAGNTFERTGVVLSISSFIYNGLMPAFRNQFVGNRVVEGNGSFGGNVGIGHATYPSDHFFHVFDGFLGRGLVTRRNIIENNGRIYVSGALRDVVLEHNIIKDSDVGISLTARKEARPKWVIVRKNVTERVKAPLVGDAVKEALVLPETR